MTGKAVSMTFILLLSRAGWQVAAETTMPEAVTPAFPGETNRQLTFGGQNAEACISHDDKQLVFASNRFGKVAGETNVFIAGW